MRKTRLREVKVGNTSVWGTLPRSEAWCRWSSNPGWPDPSYISSHHASKCCVRIRFFLLWKQLLLKAREGQPDSSIGPWWGKSRV